MEDLVKRFISGYAEEAKPQSIDDTKGDFQLTQMKILLNDIVRTNNVSTIIDIGCGNGALLYVLESLNLFKDCPKIKYYGFDLNEQIIIAIQESMNRGLFNKANFRTLQDNWANCLDKENPNLIVMRNVFHELSLEHLADYFYCFALKLQKKDFVIFQDTTTLLEAEKGRAGWKGTSIEKILQEGGFQTILTPDISKKDISVFTIKGFDKNNKKISKDEIKKLFQYERQQQLQELLSTYEYVMEDKEVGNIITARISHDILSIKKQLGQEMDDKAYEAIYLLLYYALMIIDKNPEFLNNVKEGYEYFEVIAFQNRGTPLKMIYSFLSNNDKKILEINGGKLIGKKSLIFHSLKRFKHNRIPIFIECNTSIGITQIFESIIEALNIVKYFDVELISEFEQITMGEFIKQNKYVKEFQTIIPEVIIVFLNAESLLSPQHIIENKDISEFIDWWTGFERAKIFIECDQRIKNAFRSELYDNITLSIFPLSNDTVADSYGKYRFVIQYFQETVSSNYLGLDPSKENFSEVLFECINNHPYLAYLASKIISQFENFDCLTDKKTLKKIMNKISSDFVNKFDFDKDEKGIIYALSLRDGFFERDVLDGMTRYENTINKLIDKGIIYTAGKGFYRLLPVFTRADLDAENIDKTKFIRYMEQVYTKLYNTSGKPKYFRLKYFYSILNRESVSGKISYLLPELSAGAEQFYLERDFASAVSLYKEIGNKQSLTSKQELRYGSALIRGNHVAEGIDVYKNIFAKYPTWENAKISCVDSLVHIEEKLDYCLQLMGEISENRRKTYYYRLMGEIYRIKQEPIKVFSNYDLALEKMERFDEGIRVLVRAISYAKELGDDVKQKEYFDFYHKLSYSHVGIDIEYGSFLEKRNGLVESESILAEIYENNPSNVYAIFAYVKTLCALNKYDVAKEIIDNAYSNTEILLENRNIIDSANVHYLACKNEYSEAISILEKEINKDRKNIHLYGQWADLFYKFYLTTNEPNLLDRGLCYYSQIMSTTNVPAMISCLNLAKMKGDENLINALEKKICMLNCNISI